MKRCLIFLLCAAMLFSLSACGKKNPEPPAEPDPEVPGEVTPAPSVPEAPEQKGPLEVRPFRLEDSLFTPAGKDENIEVIRLDLSFPRIKDMPKVTTAYEKMQDDLIEVYEQEVEMADIAHAEAVNRGEVFEPYAFTANYDVLCNDGVTLSIRREISETRGEEIKTYYRGETYDVRSQGRLLLGDLFKGGEDASLPELMKLVAAQIEKSETEFFTKDPVQLQNKFGTMDFALSDDALFLFFDENSIGDDAAVFELPLSELNGLLQENWVK